MECLLFRFEIDEIQRTSEVAWTNRYRPLLGGLLRFRREHHGRLGRQHEKGDGLLEVEADGGRRMAQVTDGDVLADRELKITATGREHDAALDRRRPNDLSVHEALDMLQDRIPIV